ncbi:hypothetical protein BE04_30955 [Sorangium cellulosum]|uniref:Uncharacterized protein n=2 Tax=Sorangium cellulosum TaxID=56 RepID=A0A150PMS7_SORCE|nr:hypothetical protein [Sorangium cellulosum]AGP37545.1 hypothetical protein SCE1572_25455 [Sorangium cellulosum So0157-2]KYF57037.1 hypothetical protein BE04_30955 [Sorangium cellulosum]
MVLQRYGTCHGSTSLVMIGALARHASIHPLLQRRDLPLQDLERRHLLFRVAPAEAESGLANSSTLSASDAPT